MHGKSIVLELIRDVGISKQMFNIKYIKPEQCISADIL